MDTILGVLMVGLGCFGLGALLVLVLTHGSTVWWEDEIERFDPPYVHTYGRDE